MYLREPAVAYGKSKFTIPEYLDMENNATDKHEYYRGEIFAMSGATYAHNVVCMNVATALKRKLKGKPCQPLGSDMRVYIPANSLFTYPDLSVICGKPQFLNDDERNLLNPTLIIEVLSPSTRSYDRGDKFKVYRDIPTLRDYVLVDAEQVGIEQYAMNTHGQWQLTEYKHIDETLRLKSLGLSLKLADMYEGVDFSAYS
jgi:Uma2 family endonuclease